MVLNCTIFPTQEAVGGTSITSGLSLLEQKVVSSVNGSSAYNFDLELENIAFRHYSYRSGGSSGADEAAYWIKAQFESFGLYARLESFEFTTWDLLDKPTLIIDVDGNKSTINDQILIESFQSTHLSWPTPPGGVFADLVVLPLPEAANRDEIGLRPIDRALWDSINTTGKIVLIGMEVRWSSDWEQTFVEKITSQTPATIVYTWWYYWMSFTPILLSSAGGRPLSGFGPYYWNNHIPVGAINYEDGLHIRNMECSMNVSAHVLINSVIGMDQHYNVVGMIKGYENPDKLVIISAHYDTVTCAGFCDNGAGTAGIIELARVFAEAVKEGFYRPKYTILFIAFASEELGLVGSINYVKQHKNEMPNIVAVINLDCIGSDELRVTETEPINGFDLDETIMNAAQDLGIPITYETPGGSDQETFRNPSWANRFYYWCWQLEANITDAMPVKSSALVISYPLLYKDLWKMGSPGWIHTSYDNSTSTLTLNWVEADDLESHLKVVALTILRVTPTTIITAHDVSVKGVSPSKTVVGQGLALNVNVIIRNEGNYTETLNVTAYADTITIKTLTVTVVNGSSTTITFKWNTTDFAKGNYTIWAYAWPVSGETDTGDNTFVDGVVKVTIPGDVDGDFKVKMDDIILLCKAFGSKTGQPNYNPNYDINCDGKISMDDIIIACKNFGKHYP